MKTILKKKNGPDAVVAAQGQPSITSKGNEMTNNSVPTAADNYERPAWAVDDNRLDEAEDFDGRRVITFEGEMTGSWETGHAGAQIVQDLIIDPDSGSQTWSEKEISIVFDGNDVIRTSDIIQLSELEEAIGRTRWIFDGGQEWMRAHKAAEDAEKAAPHVPCAEYGWCDGEHSQWEIDNGESTVHHDRRTVDFELRVGIGAAYNKPAGMYAVHESDGDAPDRLYVNYDEATVDVPYAEVPEYLAKMRGFIDQLETYYRLTLPEVAE